MFLSFAFMQNPSNFIKIILLISILSYIFILKKFEIFKFFLEVFILISILLFLNLNKIPIESIFQQYFLFPLTMAENRDLVMIWHIFLYQRIYISEI